MARVAGDPRVALAKKLAAARVTVAALELEVAGLGDSAALVGELAKHEQAKLAGAAVTGEVRTEKAATPAPVKTTAAKKAKADSKPAKKKKDADDDDVPF